MYESHILDRIDRSQLLFISYFSKFNSNAETKCCQHPTGHKKSAVVAKGNMPVSLELAKFLRNQYNLGGNYIRRPCPNCRSSEAKTMRNHRSTKDHDDQTSSNNVSVSENSSKDDQEDEPEESEEDDEVDEDEDQYKMDDDNILSLDWRCIPFDSKSMKCIQNYIDYVMYWKENLKVPTIQTHMDCWCTNRRRY